jgi:hypothetical protein
MGGSVGTLDLDDSIANNPIGRGSGFLNVRMKLLRYCRRKQFSSVTTEDNLTYWISLEEIYKGTRLKIEYENQEQRNIQHITSL